MLAPQHTEDVAAGVGGDDGGEEHDDVEVAVGLGEQIDDEAGHEADVGEREEGERDVLDRVLAALDHREEHDGAGAGGEGHPQGFASADVGGQHHAGGGDHGGHAGDERTGPRQCVGQFPHRGDDADEDDEEEGDRQEDQRAQHHAADEQPHADGCRQIAACPTVVLRGRLGIGFGRLGAGVEVRVIGRVRFVRIAQIPASGEGCLGPSGVARGIRLPEGSRIRGGTVGPGQGNHQTSRSSASFCESS